MITKTQRNKTLRDINRLITGTYNGETFYTPDGYFAINVDIYDGYKLKKSQTVLDTVVDMTPIIDGLNGHYTVVKKIEREDEMYFRLSSVGVPYAYKVNELYLDLMIAAYPDVSFEIDTSGYKYAPIKCMNDGKLIGMLMPVKD